MKDDQLILDAIRGDHRYLANLSWGRPRSGHPEGTVAAHIAELERNVERLGDRLSPVARQRILVLVHVHDTFKANAESAVAIDAANSHASLARSFLAEFSDDEELLAMVQWHDLPYALWRKSRRTGALDGSRFAILTESISDWHTFVAFLIVDGCTAGKSREPLAWFLGELEGRVNVDWTVDDLLESTLPPEEGATAGSF